MQARPLSAPPTRRTAGTPAGSPGEQAGSAFAALDRLAADPEAAGFVSVSGPRAGLRALAAHAARRAKVAGRKVVAAGGEGACDDPWRELASSQDVDPNRAPEVVAAELLAVLDDARALILAHDEPPTLWGGAVAAELARRAGGSAALVLALGEPRGCEGAVSLALDGPLSEGDVGLWVQALAGAHELGSLADLERLMQRGLTRGEPGPEPAQVNQVLLRQLGLCRRGCSPELARRLGSPGELRALVAAGLACLDEGGRLVARAEADVAAGEATAGEAALVAAALRAEGAGDPWALLRAAELHAAAGDLPSAGDAAVEALRSAVDPLAREDLYRRIDALLRDRQEPIGWELPLRLSEVAREQGDPERVLAFARRAAAEEPEQPAVMLALGSACTARGDLETAAVALDRALALVRTRRQRAQVAVQLAELHYAAGELDAARAQAAAALEQAADVRTQLAARNVIGKLLLASAEWQCAEEHFAADAALAACAGEVEAELRARLNRTIAVMESGCLNHARTLLEGVLADARRLHSKPAEAMALANLSTVLTLTHEYAEALQRLEQAIAAMQTVGNQLPRAALIMNLAELRLRLGLVSEAEEALRFARQACGPSVPPSHLTLLSFVAGKIHLARGKSRLAAADVEEALSAIGSSKNGAKLGQCQRLAARIALHDGDAARAAEALERARQCPHRPDAAADLALLEAQLERALGTDFEAAAERALQLAEAAHDEDRQRDAHVLLAHAADLRDDAEAAGEHLGRAVELRDRMAAGLPRALRERWLQRADLRQLDELGAQRAPHPAPATVRGAALAGAGAAAASRRYDPRNAGEIIGESQAIRQLRATIERVGPNDVTVLIQGESGTGKELVAEALHRASERRGGPLVKVNCAALVETLLLSELFGHEKGAFTGASSRRRGRFELASGGTLFLDEIGDISPRTQVALLRVLQDKTFERVGGTAPRRADVRVICATNRDLEALVQQGRFREDLFYRLCGVSLQVPALRERLDDLPLLAEALLARIAAEQGGRLRRLSAGACRALRSHPWPGNVRELGNALRTAALFTDGDVIETADLTRNFPGLSGLGAAPLAAESGVSLRAAPAAGEGVSSTDVVYAEVLGGASLPALKRQLEHACITRALADAEGNVTRAAALLGMKRSRVSQLVNQHGLRVAGGQS